MSKIICDVCGTSYPETATQCPICGCVRPGDAVTVAGDTTEPDTQMSGTYTYVKGGRFSKSNVKKRNQGKQSVPVTSAQQAEEPVVEEKKDKGLVIAVVALLLAIVAVVIYIALRFFGPGFIQGGTQTDGGAAADTSSSTTEDTQNITEATVLEIPCVELVLSKSTIEFDKAGAALLLNVTASPADTTDLVVFASSDETVATVSQDGKVVAVGGGEAVITVTCGDVQSQCSVVCNIEVVNTEETTVPSFSADELELNREDFTLNSKGATWKLYAGEIPADQITWTSDDDSVATINNGVVIAVGSGVTTVYGEYGGKKVSCIVRCAETVGKADDSASTSESNTGNGANTTGYSISDTDVTIKVGESFVLLLKDANGSTVNVTWVVADGSICTAVDGKITGTAVGKTMVSVTYEGSIYSCVVRVVGN